MTNLLNLKPGDRARWVRFDPEHGDYGIGEKPEGQLCVVRGYGDDRTDGNVSYRCHIEGIGNWFILSSMLDLEEGPW